jgi:hypothetical protein
MTNEKKKENNFDVTSNFQNYKCLSMTMTRRVLYENKKLEENLHQAVAGFPYGIVKFA